MSDGKERWNVKDDYGTTMAILGSRNKLIYFRVTEEELERFRSLAESKGARSLSDLAREAIERLHQAEPEQSAGVPVLLERIHVLQSTLNSMSGRLEELSSKLVNSTQSVEEKRTA